MATVGDTPLGQIKSISRVFATRDGAEMYAAEAKKLGMEGVYTQEVVRTEGDDVAIR